MEKLSTDIKFFVNPDNKVTIVCPDCHNPKTISVEQFRGKKHALNVKCKCGHQFKMRLEFRRYRRKETDIGGLYEHSSETKAASRVKVTDLSLGGVRFETFVPNDLKVGEKGKLVFTLDDRKETVVAKDVIIRSINGNVVGCEFFETQAYDKELGFYVRP